MKGLRGIIGIAAASLAFSGMACQLAPSPAQLQAIEERCVAAKPKAYRKRVNLGVADSTPKYRSRRKPAKPRKHPNRLTISKRVRRKHRRRAA